MSAAGRTIREIRIESGGNTLSQTSLPLKTGEVLTPDSLGRAEAAIRDRIRAEEPANAANRGGIQIIFVKACVLAVDSTQVDVILTPWAARVPLNTSSQGRLDQPQSGKAVVHGNLPGLQRVFNPRYGISYDRSLDVSARAGFSTSLLELKNVVSHTPEKVHQSDFKLFGDGALSMKSPNYLALAGAGYDQRSLTSGRKFGLSSTFVNSRQPWGADDRFQNSVRSAVSLRFGHVALLRGLGISLAHQWSNNRTSVVRTSENLGEFRTVFDYRILDGVGRTSLIVDAAKPDKGPSYSRIAFRSGLSSEIPLIKERDADHQPLDATHTLGLEFQVTAGQTTNTAPDYAQFRGGSDSGRFVFDDSLDAQLGKPFQMGPIVRSFGQSQTDGADRYFGFNLNLAIPIPRWSRFLIPPDRDEDGHTLAERIEGAGLNSSEVLMASYYENEEHLAPAIAARKAKADIDSVRPAVRYVSRYAKLFGVRPLLMFDFAQLRHPSNTAATNENLYSGGLGAQFSIVTARAEAGYVWLLNPMVGRPGGNVVFRLSFQNLF